MTGDSYAGAAAREYLRLSGEALAMNSAQRAIAFALQGILRMQMASVDGAGHPKAPPDLLTDPVADGGRWTRPGRCNCTGGRQGQGNCTGACLRTPSL